MENKSVSRRDALRLAGVAGLTAAAAQLSSANAQTATPAASSSTPALPVNGSGFYRFKVGEYTVTVLSDGQSPPGNTFPNWGANPDRQPVYEAALRENFLDPSRFVNNFNPMIVDTGKNKVLMDTGRGGQNGQLLASLARAGYKAEDIDTVFLTHGHGDHIGGLTMGGQPTFPKAQLVMGEGEFQFWTTQATPNDAVKNNMIALKDRYKLIKPGADIVGGVTSLASFGHTANHLAVRVSSGTSTLTHFADAGGHYILSFRFPEHYLGFDTDKAQAVATRAKLFAEAADTRQMVVGYHYAWPAVGYVKRKDSAFEYVPAFFQLT